MKDGTNRFFFDTYALFEIIRGSEKYENYTNAEIITTKLNLMELYNGFVREGYEDEGEYYYNRFLSFVVEFTDDDLKEAVKFRNEQNKILEKEKKNKMSYIDAIGYKIAERLKIKFLTGDGQFEGLKNVEFVE